MSTTARAQVMSWGIAASIAACVVLSTASGQEQKTRPTDPDRFEIRSAEAGPPTQAKEEGKPLPDPVMIPASDIVYLTDLGDEPSYAPMEEIRGGPENAVLEIRLRGNPYVLSFTNGDFTPEPGIDPALARRLAHGDKPHTYGFVMIKGRMSREKLKTLQELGVEFLGVHTWQSIKAKIPLTALKGMDALPFVHWVGFARPEQKLQKQLADALQGAAQGQVFEIYVQPFESDLNKDSETREIGETSVVGDLDAGVARAVQLPTREIVPNGPVQKGIEALGFEFDWYIPQIHCFKGRATKAQILKIRDLDYVHTVELYFPAKVGHDHALAMVSQDRIRKTYPGAKVPIGVIDTGIDSSPWHQDFSSKVFLGWQTTTATVFQDGHGHGTHVSGTMFGRGIADRRYTGCVPSVGLGGEGDRIFVGRYLNDSGSGEGNVSTLYTALGQNQTWAGKSNPKPAIVNNSWGGYSSSGFNGADSRARTLDASVWSTNQTYAFCVGNKDGKAGTWAWSPGAAKNALTVGRVTDYGTSTKKPGQPSANSRWNTTDGRIKPEIAAPGEVHTSCLFNTTTGYGNKSGCSMATPTAVGVLASLVDRDTAFQYWPSATKAVTVASAVVDGRPLANGTSSSSAKRGHGIINSYKLNWTNRTTFNPWMGVFTSAGGSTTRTLAVNAGLQAVKIVLSWTEPAASSSATKARLNDLRVYVDAPPYTGNATTGDFTLSSTKDNTIWYTSYATAATNLATKIKGQTIQLKIHAKSMAPSSSARFTLVVFQYFKMPSTSSTYAPTLSTSVDKSYVKPLGTVKLTTSLSAKSTADDFNDARIYLYGPTSWVTTALSRTTDDSLVHNYSGDTAASFPSWPHPRVRTGSAYGMTVGQGTSRRMIWTLRAPSTSGWHSLNPRATYHGTSLLSTFRSVCVDGSRPNTISNLKSTTHPLGGWSNKTSFVATWNTPTDVGCAGIGGLAYRMNIGLGSTPTVQNITGAATSKSLSLLTSTSTGYYFRIRGVDRAGNFSLSTATIGPFKLDLTKPSVSTVVINNNATYTGSLIVDVKASGSDSYSGIKEMRYSGNNSTWSAWRSYSTLPRKVNLASYGASTAEGTKFAYVQVRDNAGNVSASRLDSIIYRRIPNISGGTILSLPNVTRGFYRLTGTDFSDVTKVTFGTTSITAKWTSANDDWWATGAFRPVGDTVMYVYPPIGLMPSNYPVRFTNFGGTSAALNVRVTSTLTRTLYSNSQLTAGKMYTLAMARNGEPTSTMGIIVISPVKSPSVLPGVISLEIGANFLAYVTLPTLPFNSAGVMKLQFPTGASWKGYAGYIEGVYFRNPLPLPTTNSWHAALK